MDGSDALADGTGSAGGDILLPERADLPSGAEIAARADRSLLAALLDARRAFGGDKPAIEDGDRRVLTYTELVRAAAALSRVLGREAEGERVGILLPSSVGAAVAYFAVLAAGRTPVMLNFTAGPATVAAACRIADVRTVLTADRFVALARLGPLVDVLKPAHRVLPLERLREGVGRVDKLYAAAAAPLGLFPRLSPDDPACIVFTSGSEGEPKGVVLTHRNLLSNVEQVRLSLPVERAKVFFNPLPIFHCYGLIPGMLLPLVLGAKTVVHPSPLRAKEVALRIAETEANVLVATDTFLRQYARVGDPGSLSSLHFAVCGAERVRAETRELVRSRFGFEVVEGYGVTETSPVLAANHPDDIRDGTVGCLLPGIEARLEAVPGLDGGYRLHVRGPNVMAGYLTSAGLVPPPGGWHDTGDVVAVEDGRLVIRGRLKRFAKIGGEMTSLATVENLAGMVWPDALHAAAAVPGGRKGEAIVLLTEEKAPDADLLRLKVREMLLTERFLPDRIIPVAEIPLLGTGKVDFVAVTRLAAELLAADADASGADAAAASRT
jgi:acyl-[acyl-carrier-protein]-phospholipid O-acyltransferase/long-chain-fatty-acid--[acyl-carrier-protein] ligase